MIAYKHTIREVWAALESNGIYPDGKTRLAEVIAKHTAPPAAAPDDAEALRRDAERYRWMKREVKRIPPSWGLVGWDAAIDAAVDASTAPEDKT